MARIFDAIKSYFVDAEDAVVLTKYFQGPYLSDRFSESRLRIVIDFNKLGFKPKGYVQLLVLPKPGQWNLLAELHPAQFSKSTTSSSLQDKISFEAYARSQPGYQKELQAAKERNDPYFIKDFERFQMMALDAVFEKEMEMLLELATTILQ